MGIIYQCFWKCNNSLAMYFLSSEGGFLRSREEVMGVSWGREWSVEPESRGDVELAMAEMEIVGHEEEKELMDLLQVQGFS